MSNRLQVFLKETEYREIQRAARSRKISVAEWVRQALSLVRRSEPSGSVGEKLEAIRAAARLEYPTTDIDRMLMEIEFGYRGGESWRSHHVRSSKSAEHCHPATAIHCAASGREATLDTGFLDSYP
jgi:hypothetical protein